LAELRELVHKAQQGDLEAYGELVERFQNMALSKAHSSLGDVHLAQDVAQESFIQAFHDLASLRVPEAFATWFRRIVTKHVDRVVRKKVLPTTQLDNAETATDDAMPPDEVLKRKELKALVLAALKALPERQRTPMTLHYVDGMSQKDVAEFMQVPLTTVKKRLYTARKAMRMRMIDQDEEYPEA
jgi:RNA polymerase sigma factor (sigma-70 family)